MIHSCEEWESLCANELPIPLSGSDCVGTAHDTFLLIALPFLSWRGTRPRSLPLGPVRNENGKAKPAARIRGDVDAVPRIPSAWRTMTGESLEDLRHLFARNSSARVEPALRRQARTE